jgi:hypothetical protein
LTHGGMSSNYFGGSDLSAIQEVWYQFHVLLYISIINIPQEWRQLICKSLSYNSEFIDWIYKNKNFSYYFGFTAKLWKISNVYGSNSNNQTSIKSIEYVWGKRFICLYWLSRNKQLHWIVISLEISIKAKQYQL